MDTSVYDTNDSFFGLSFAFFSLPYAFQEDRNGNRLRNIQHSPIPIWQYYLSKILAILVHFILAILVVFAVGHFVKGVDMWVREWLTSGSLLFVGAICFMPFGALFCSYQVSPKSLPCCQYLLYTWAWQFWADFGCQCSSFLTLCKS